MIDLATLCQLFAFKKSCFSYEIAQISVFSPVKPSKLWANSYNLSFKKGGKNFLLGGERQGNLGGGIKFINKIWGRVAKREKHGGTNFRHKFMDFVQI